jgi:hypothetical protein
LTHRTSPQAWDGGGNPHPRDLDRLAPDDALGRCGRQPGADQLDHLIERNAMGEHSSLSQLDEKNPAGPAKREAEEDWR